MDSSALANKFSDPNVTYTDVVQYATALRSELLAHNIELAPFHLFCTAQDFDQYCAARAWWPVCPPHCALPDLLVLLGEWRMGSGTSFLAALTTAAERASLWLATQNSDKGSVPSTAGDGGKGAAERQRQYRLRQRELLRHRNDPIGVAEQALREARDAARDSAAQHRAKIELARAALQNAIDAEKNRLRQGPAQSELTVAHGNGEAPASP